jgi:hypothetical protein
MVHGRRTCATSLHRRGLTDPATTGTKGTTKTKKHRWGHHALLAGFAKHRYLKVSNCVTISKSTMDRRNPNLG